jgi:hypothetical protein
MIGLTLETAEAIQNVLRKINEGMNRVDEQANEMQGKLSETVRAIWDGVYNIAEILLWGMIYRPRLYHLARYGKNERIRKKNRRRIIREFWYWKEHRE